MGLQMFVLNKHFKSQDPESSCMPPFGRQLVFFICSSFSRTRAFPDSARPQDRSQRVVPKSALSNDRVAEMDASLRGDFFEEHRKGGF